MFNPSEPQVLPVAIDIAILTELIDTGNLLDATTLILFQNDIVPTPATVMSDLTEATFTGYAAAAAIVWGTPYLDVTGIALVTAASHEFVSTGSTIGNIIYGWALTNAAKTDLKKAARFTTPIGISATGEGVTVVPWWSNP